ncbi:MAG: bile acid:sodium symporter [Sedimenticola sp.]
MNSYFLPVGLLLAFLVAWIDPDPGTRLQQMGLIPWVIVTIFLINGYQIDLKKLPRGRSVLTASMVAILISLLISPFIGLAAVSAMSLPAGAALGLVVMATVPPTLSSGIVMTGIAGGNVAKALFLTILLNLAGVFTIPYMLHFTLESVGIISISPLPLLKQLILVVLIPFLVGMWLKSVIRISSRHWVLRYLPSSCVIATVWMSVSTSVDTLKAVDLQLLLFIAVGALIVHGALLMLCWLVRFLYQPARGEWLALLFTASQKTLPVAIGVLAALNQPIGLAVVVCIIFHFLQLFIDSMIASRMGRESKGKESALTS